MALSQMICLGFAYFMCVSGMTIDEIIQAASNSSGQQSSFVPGNSRVLFELDMIMDKVDRDRIYGSFGHRQKRLASKANYTRWTDNTLYYDIHSFRKAQRKIITGAMAVWASHTCLQFRKSQNQNELYYLKFTASTGCHSCVGRKGAGQIINLGKGCVNTPIVIHELGHAIGLHHTHSRPDRDDYVIVNMSNVKHGDKDLAEDNLEKARESDVTTFGFDYDYYSIMHYGKKAFAKNGTLTIVPKDHTYLDIIGNSMGPSFGDIKMVNNMYNCHAHCPDITCPCNGFLNKDCECICPGDPKKVPPTIKCIEAKDGPCAQGGNALGGNKLGGNELGDMQENLKQLQNTVEGLKKDLEKSKQQQSQLQNEMKKVTSLTAFHAYMVEGYIPPEYGDVIPFNRVITNIGGGFNATTHKFRCPVTGVYAFWLTVKSGALGLSDDKRFTIPNLMLDSTKLTTAHCYFERDKTAIMMCSNQAVTECQAGSHVWVRSGTKDVVVTVYGNTYFQETTFSGFLLKAT